MKEGERSYRSLQAVASAAFLGVLWTGGAYAWWRWLDPIFPEIKVLHAEIHEREAANEGVFGRRIFEVHRTIESSADFRGTLLATFEKPPPDEPLEYEGRAVVRDPVRHSMPATDVHIEKGVHRRDRLWETWALIESGAYRYSVMLRGCNPVRCADLPFPPLPVTIR